MKCEKYYLHKYDSNRELKQSIADYIHFYNHYRYQKRLNGLSPLEFEGTEKLAFFINKFVLEKDRALLVQILNRKRP
ncbi:IS3 family transposase, partial [Lysinibacillus sp. NPDC058147]|uniref:IS3 family transposase n=1 Tax=unclassified Lysinibacillus TaxID=2636778 RepID=UPI0036DE1500